MDSESRNNRPRPKIVSIGSVSAASLLINGFRDQIENLTAIVPTTDTGSSTGIIRKKFSLPAPGDVRAVLSAMGDNKDHQATLKKLFEYRFKSEHFVELGNMALGNLVLAALTEITGSFSGAVKKAGEMLGIKGKVLPVTTANTNIKAILANGEEVWGEEEVRRLGKPSIQKLFLENSSVELGEGVSEALMEADIIVIGPGCLYTSVIACLVVPGFTEFLQKTEAKIIYCCNTTTTPGQTDGLTVLDHVEIITRYLNNIPPHYVLVNNKKPQQDMEEAYRQDNIYLILPTPDEVERIREMGSFPVLTDLIEEGWKGKRTLHKLDTIRHDPQKVRKVLLAIYEGKIFSPGKEGTEERR
jgi:uncharacterized cofD-like protein